MLGKLMKYEFKATGRVFLPMFAALLVLSVVNRLLMGLGVNAPKIIGIIISVILMVGIVVLCLILTIQRFYKNLLGTEGYLMLTLPVKTDCHILSKLFVASIWNVVCSIIVLLAILIMAVTNIDFSDIRMLFDGFLKLLPSERFHAVLYIIEAVVGGVFYLFSGILTLYACISLSLLVNRLRGLFTFAAFIVISAVLQILGVLVFMVLDSMDISRIFGDLSGTGMLHITLLSNIFVSLLLCCVFYFTTRYMLKNRLNLQ